MRIDELRGRLGVVSHGEHVDRIQKACCELQSAMEDARRDGLTVEVQIVRTDQRTDYADDRVDWLKFSVSKRLGGSL